MMIDVDIQYASDAPDLPEQAQLTHWVKTVLQADPPHQKGNGENRENLKTLENDPLFSSSIELTIRIVDEVESKQLNETWRQCAKPTNVLSFPFESPPGIELPLLGDLVICAPIVALEAAEQHKSTVAHWAHLVIHGTLHLLGYDHIDETQAQIMEALEIKLLHDLDYPNPYLIQ
jgi:probable rRNA maturation factor